MSSSSTGTPTFANRIRAFLSGGAPREENEAVAPSGTEGARPRVLCVDDNLEMLALLQRHLQGNYHVVTASDGTSALDILRSGLAVDAIISDLLMPGLHGVTFLKEARRIAPSTPCIILTGQNDPTTRATARRAAGAEWLLFKPYSKAELFAVVREATRRPAKASA